MRFKERVFCGGLVFLLMSFGLVVPASGQPAPVPPSTFPGLVSWWRAEGNFADSFDGNTGFQTGGVVNFVPGKVGQAFSFNGTDGYVRVPASANLPSGNSPRTFVAWVYTRPSSWVDNVNTVFHYGGQSTRQSFSLDMRPWPNMEFYAWDEDIVFDAGVPQEGWVHIAITYDGNMATVYTQGQFRGSRTYPVGLNTANTGLDIGRIPPPFSPSYFDGLIDEFAIYNRALTPAEVQALVGPPPFTFDKPLPNAEAHICLPPFMVQEALQNPAATHIWWAKAMGGNLVIKLFALAVNPDEESGRVIMKVFDPTGAPVGSPVTVVHPTSPSLPGSEDSATISIPVTLPFPLPPGGDLYRIEVNVGPPPSPAPSPHPNRPARHYRLELTRASLLGANSPLQAQAEHDDARWGVNVKTGEPLNIVVQGGPEAGATMGTVEVRNPSGILVATGVISAPAPAPPTPITVPTSNPNWAAGMWTVSVLGASVPPPGGGGHYIINKTSGADRGLYVAWDTWGFGMLSGSITRGTAPNPTPVIVELLDATGSVILQTITGATSSYQFDKLPIGTYTVRVITPPNLLAAVPTSSSRLITCDAHAVADFDIPNQEPDCSNVAPSIAQIWPPNHKMVNITILNVTDPDGDPVTITVTKITQDEPLNTVGDGNFEPDGAIINNGSTAQVRAERTGTPRIPGNGRCYHITFTASDGQGGTCEGVVRTCVPHDQAHPAVDGGPLYDSITGASITSVASKPVAEEFAPETEFDLTFSTGNYPNPFNPSTTIRYTLPEASSVRLTIYNVLGQEIRTLVNAAQSRGVHSVQWDGRDASGRQAATGVYIYRLEAGSYVATRNMVFTK